jgi:probable HAF family extracellular repeat protein
LCTVLALGALACERSSPPPVAASSDELKAPSSGQRYVVIPLDSLGGTVSQGNSINDLGWVSGLSALAGNGTVHATIWRGRTPKDLGTLGGPNSAVLWPSKNVIDLVAGVSETNQDQPLGERWSCNFFFPHKTGKTCLGVVWDHGNIRALATFGGENGFATSANNKRQVVGWAETTMLDSSCTGAQKRQFIAALWGPGNDDVQQLPPLPGDSTSVATGINDRGQVIGISGACGIAVGGVSARRAVMWEGGSITDLGTLNGDGWNTPMALNAWGDVVGFANAPGTPVTDFIPLPFLWTRSDGIQALPLLPGHDNGQALGINLWRQVVGVSCAGGDCKGVLWMGGKVIDLGSRVITGLNGTITNAGDIDDLGRIGGQFVDTGTGATIAFRAIPGGSGMGDHDDDGMDRHRGNGMDE